MATVEICDVTCRDGQQQGIKKNIKLALKALSDMDRLGIGIIELGCEGSNTDDDDFIRRALPLQSEMNQAIFTVFCILQRRGEKFEDSSVVRIVNMGAKSVTLVVKSRENDVKLSLLLDPREYLKNIERSIRYAKKNGLNVIVDFEHFVDTWFGRGDFGRPMNAKIARKNKKYLFEVIKVAEESGADCLVICDTSGGAKTNEIAKIFKALNKKYPDVKFGVHCHNDRARAVENSLAAIRNGAKHIQTTVNGYGERCGNTNMGILLGLLEIEDKIYPVPRENLKTLPKISTIIANVFGLKVNPQTPIYGKRAFGTSAGIHAVSDIRQPGAYYHCDPIIFGNEPDNRIDDNSGDSSVILFAEKLGINIDKKQANRLMKKFPKMVSYGAFNESREAFILALLELTGQLPDFFHVNGHFYSGETGKKNNAWVEVLIKGRIIRTEVTTYNGPYDALAKALNKALKDDFPDIKKITMQGHHPETFAAADDGSGAMVRITIPFAYNGDIWKGVGVDPDSPMAGFKALVMGYKWFLYKQYAQKGDGVY